MFKTVVSRALQVAPVAILALGMHAANAGTIILEGSDAIEFHCAGEAIPGACTYAGQVWKALDGASGKPIASIEGSSPIALGSYGSGITIDNFATVAAAGSLSQYAALYFQGDAGDDGGPEGDVAISAAGAAAAVTAYLAAGGTVMIEDYGGGAPWAFAVGASGDSNIAGYGGGSPVGSDSCDDGETVTALGTTNGFTQPPAIGCWEHQAYSTSFYGALGFTKSFFDAGPGMVSGATTGWSGLLSSGSTLTASAPEPASMMLMGTGLACLGFFGRRRIKKSKS